MPHPLDRELRKLRAAALGYPEAMEDFPWGECTVKVRGRIFVFLSRHDGGLSVSTKLPHGSEFALLLPFASPTGYGLGKSGWVTARFDGSDAVPVPLLIRWIDESYRAVAPPPGGGARAAPAGGDPARDGRREARDEAGAGAKGPPMKRSAVILDFDGVLADSAQVYVELYRDLAAHEGKASPVSTVAEWREWYQPRWERNFEALGIPAQRLPDVVAWCFGRLRYDRVGLFPGVPALLDDLGRDCALAIASSTRASLIEQVLEREGLSDRFALVLGGTARGSDKSEMVGDAVRALGAGPGRTVMVGDTTADLDAARACGLPTVGVTYGWMTPSRLAAASPEALAGSPAEIAPAVRTLLAQRLDVPSPRPRG